MRTFKDFIMEANPPWDKMRNFGPVAIPIDPADQETSKPKPKPKSRYHCPDYSITHPDSLRDANSITFSYDAERDKLYCSPGGLTHIDQETVVRNKEDLKINLNTSNCIQGRIGKPGDRKCPILAYYYDPFAEWGENHVKILLSYLAYHHSNVSTPVENVQISMSNGGWIDSEDFLDGITPKTCKNYMWIEWEDNQPQHPSNKEEGCPDIDYQNLMRNLHTGTASQRAEIQRTVCSLKADPIKCPKTAQQIQNLRSRVNCKAIGGPVRRDPTKDVAAYNRFLNMGYQDMARRENVEIKFKEWLENYGIGDPNYKPPAAAHYQKLLADLGAKISPYPKDTKVVILFEVDGDSYGSHWDDTPAGNALNHAKWDFEPLQETPGLLEAAMGKDVLLANSSGGSFHEDWARFKLALPVTPELEAKLDLSTTYASNLKTGFNKSPIIMFKFKGVQDAAKKILYWGQAEDAEIKPGTSSEEWWADQIRRKGTLSGQGPDRIDPLTGQRAKWDGD